MPLFYKETRNGVNLGGGTTVRVDKPHVPSQQTHAHVETPKGSAVVNKDGSQSHKGKGNMNNLTNKAKKFLRELGFKNLVKGLILNPCLLNPISPGCSNNVSQCPTL